MVNKRAITEALIANNILHIVASEQLSGSMDQFHLQCQEEVHVCDELH